MNIKDILQFKHPKLFIKQSSLENVKYQPESHDGHIEYKRNLTHCDKKKIEKYATQMRWRISQNIKRFATYYIGIDDNGSIVGLDNHEIEESVDSFIEMAKIIDASITCLEIININNTTILTLKVKLKKIHDNFVIDF